VTQWVPFLALTAVLTVFLLALARRSQRVIEEYAPDETDDRQNDGAPAGDERLADEDGGTPDRGSAIPAEDGTTDSHEPRDDRPDAEFEREPTGDEPGQAHPGDEFGWESPDDESERESPGNDVERAYPGDEIEQEVPESDVRRSPVGEIELTSGLLLTNVAFTQGLVILVLGVAAWYFGIPGDALGITGEANAGLPAVVIGLGFGVVLWVGNELSTSLADAVGAAYDERVRELLAPDSPRGWAVLFAGVLPLIAVGEELLFRGALIGVPEMAYGVNVWALAVVSSLAFALGHGAQGRVGVVVTGALGFVLAAGYVATGSLLVVVVAHYVINALEFLVHELLDVGDIDVEWVRALAR